MRILWRLSRNIVRIGGVGVGGIGIVVGGTDRLIRMLMRVEIGRLGRFRGGSDDRERGICSLLGDSSEGRSFSASERLDTHPIGGAG